MHPSCALIVWLVAVLTAQYVGYPSLIGLVLVALLLAPNAIHPWFAFVRRARWLLLALWLIMAYNTAGEAISDMPWAPTYEGVAEANLQAMRLLAVLVFLAWLFVRLGRDGMIAGIWGLLQPFRFAGLDTERLVVRLSLVLDNLQTKPEKGSWRRMLSSMPIIDGPCVLHIGLVSWRTRDTIIMLAAVLGLIGVIVL